MKHFLVIFAINFIAWLIGLAVMWWYFHKSKLVGFAVLVPDKPEGTLADWFACFLWTLGLLAALLVIGPLMLVSRMWRGRY